MRILVLAPRFPSLNQPWIDTYLEQLIKNNINFRIYSSLESPEKYNSKVDELDLLSKLLDINLATKNLIYFLLSSFIFHPIDTFKNLITCFKRARSISISPNSHFISTISFFYFLKNAELFKEISLIHSHEEICGYIFLHLSEQLNIPMVLTFHGLPPAGVSQLDGLKRHVLYDNISAVLVNTEFAKQQVIGLGAKKSSVQIIPQGLPIEDFPFNPAAPPEPGQALKILTIGRFHRDKGQRYALLALKRLLDAGYFIEWYFVGVGTGVEELKQFAALLNVDKHVHFHVELSDIEVKRLYQQCHIFALCSVDNAVHIETQGVVIQEAQASGCLVIATSVGGVPECIHNQVDGLLIKARSSRALYEAVQYFYNNHDIWNVYLDSGRKNVNDNFSANVIGEKMANILKTLHLPEK